jgi:putative flavoprotein involved in K+ transport
MEGTMDGGSSGADRFGTVIIGGGQAGLAAGYHLGKREIPFVILDASARIGDAWRNRWDSLRLFTPARYDGLPGWRFPAPPATFPTKDEMADYLEAYAKRFHLPVRSGVGVDRLSREGDRFVVSSGDRRFEADQVVVATGANRIPRIPPFAPQLGSGIVQLHSSEYKNPSQLQNGDVLLVGAGNSGAEIANEVCRTHRTWLAGPDTGHVPVRHGKAAARFVFPLVRFVGQHVLTKGTPIGRKVGPKLIAKGDPLIRVKPKDLAAAGVERVPRVVGVRDGLPLLQDDRPLDVANVVWCTGFRSDFAWIDLPVFGDDGQPLHTRGVVDSEPGLYFVGLVFQYSLSSDVLPGRGRDAEYIARHMASLDANGRGPSGRPGGVRRQRAFDHART